jgi:hypothetical protein
MKKIDEKGNFVPFSSMEKFLFLRLKSELPMFGVWNPHFEIYHGGMKDGFGIH